MTTGTQSRFDFPAGKGRRVETEFIGGDLSSGGGVMLLRKTDRLMGLM